jgi:hypothetical protein
MSGEHGTTQRRGGARAAGGSTAAAARAPAPVAPGAASEALAFRTGLGAGEPLGDGVRGRMERAFGRDFSGVRLHPGRSLPAGALAAAVGDDVALAPRAPRPGTLRGDALLAHELAHTAQQARATEWGGGSAPALEGAANAAAAAALLGRPMPGLGRSGLQLRACTPTAKQKQEAADLLTNPSANQAAILKGIEDAGNDLPDILVDHPYFVAAGQDHLRHWARLPGAQTVLQTMADKLKGMSGTNATVVLSNLNPILAERTAPDLKRTPSEEAELAKIQAAIDADPRKADYTDAKKLDPPLRFPVKMYQSGREETSQVYYDPSLPRASTGAAGVTGGDFTGAVKIEGKRSEIKVAPFVRIGPLALVSDEVIRSTMYHESLHYRTWAEQQKGAAGDPVALQIRGMASGARLPNEDMEILGQQVRDYGPKLTADEIGQLYWYMAAQLKTGTVVADIRDRAFDRAASAAADPAVRKKLIAAFGFKGLAKDELALLTDLKTKITAAGAAPAPTKKPGGK